MLILKLHLKLAEQMTDDRLPCAPYYAFINMVRGEFSGCREVEVPGPAPPAPVRLLNTVSLPTWLDMRTSVNYAFTYSLLPT